MQNSTPTPSFHSATHSATATTSPHQTTEPAALARAYERARERVLIGFPLATDLLSVLVDSADEFPDEKTRPYEPTAHDAVAAPGLGVRLTLDELLPVFREPLAWALVRAEREAQGDPADLGALARMRAAFQSRLAWIYSGGAVGQSHPDVRPTDVVIAMGLLVRSIDPNLAQRAAVRLRGVVRNLLATVTPLVEAHSRRAMESPRPVATRRFGLDDVLALFGAPRSAHPPTSAGRCPHGHPL